MNVDQGETQRTFDCLGREQMKMYAREFQKHFQQELCLQRELEGSNWQLEQRLRELSALNRMVQEHLRQRLAVVEAYQEVLATLRRISQETAAVAAHAERGPLLDVQAPPDPTWNAGSL